jgi:hypothetical protein
MDRCTDHYHGAMSNVAYSPARALELLRIVRLVSSCIAIRKCTNSMPFCIERRTASGGLNRIARYTVDWLPPRERRAASLPGVL